MSSFGLSDCVSWVTHGLVPATLLATMFFSVLVFETSSVCVDSDRDELAFQLATLAKESCLDSGNSAYIPVPLFPGLMALRKSL